MPDSEHQPGPALGDLFPLFCPTRCRWTSEPFAVLGLEAVCLVSDLVQVIDPAYPLFAGPLGDLDREGVQASGGTRWFGLV